MFNKLKVANLSIYQKNLFFIRLIIRRIRKIIQIIMNMSNYFFQCIYTLLKTLADNNCHLSGEQNPS